MPDAQLLTRAIETAIAIGAGGIRNTDIYCQGDATLVVQVEMTGAAIGDLTVAVQPFEADNLTVAPISIPPVQFVGPTLNAGKVYYYAQYDIQALEKARIAITNNNAGAQTINRWSWRLS